MYSSRGINSFHIITLSFSTNSFLPFFSYKEMNSCLGFGDSERVTKYMTFYFIIAFQLHIGKPLFFGQTKHEVLQEVSSLCKWCRGIPNS